MIQHWLFTLKCNINLILNLDSVKNPTLVQHHHCRSDNLLSSIFFCVFIRMGGVCFKYLCYNAALYVATLWQYMIYNYKIMHKRQIMSYYFNVNIIKFEIYGVTENVNACLNIDEFAIVRIPFKSLRECALEPSRNIGGINNLTVVNFKDFRYATWML